MLTVKVIITFIIIIVY